MRGFRTINPSRASRVTVIPTNLRAARERLLYLLWFFGAFQAIINTDTICSDFKEVTKWDIFVSAVCDLRGDVRNGTKSG